MANLRYVGKNVPFVESNLKATGRAIYGSDVVLPRMLHGKILRSPFSHARVMHIDTSKAEKLPGVKFIATPYNSPSNRFGPLRPDECFFTEEPRYIGDEIVGVVAIDRDIASEALELIKVDYEELPAVFDPFEAIHPGSPLVHSEMSSNLCYHTEISRGDIERGFIDADIIHEETYHLPHQYHAFIETHTTTASWEGDRLTIWAPAQGGRTMKKIVNEAFGISAGSFRFIQTHVGGAFGGKGYMRLWTITALLAKLANAPVQITLDRQEDFEAGFPAVPMVINLKMGVTKEGVFTAKDTYILADNGAYTYKAPAILDVAVIRVDSLYKFKNTHVVGDLVYTNKVGTSAFRGFGNTQSHFAVEAMIDTLAEKINMDSMELRLINATQQGDETVHGYFMGSCELSKTIKKAANVTNWKSKRGSMRNVARGIGMACGLHVSGSVLASPAGDGSYAKIQLHEDGTIHISSSEGDIGQGANTILAQIAAEELGINISRVFVNQHDSDDTYFGVGASGSRVTMMAGNAVHLAVNEVIQEVKRVAADKWQCTPDWITFLSGKVINYQTEQEMDLSEVAKYYVGMSGGSRIVGHGRFRATGVSVPDKSKFGNISLAYSFATNVAEVEVDIETGLVELIRITGVYDIGRAINPMGVEGQIEGGVVQGIGYALNEEYLFKDGLLLNPNFTDYQIPTSLDVPEIDVYLIESLDPNGPFGAKSVGEMAMVPTAPAIANAIYDAIGVRITELPATPERILHLLEKKRESF